MYTHTYGCGAQEGRLTKDHLEEGKYTKIDWLVVSLLNYTPGTYTYIYIYIHLRCTSWCNGQSHLAWPIEKDPSPGSHNLSVPWDGRFIQIQIQTGQKLNPLDPLRAYVADPSS